MFRVVRKKSAGAAMRRAFPTKIRGYGSTSIEFLGIPTLSRRGVARATWARPGAAPPRGPPRRRGARGAACGGTRQLAPRSRRTRSPCRFGEAWAAQGAENLLTYLLPGPHRAVCAQTGEHAAPPGRTRTRVHTWPRATRRGAAGVARPRRRSTGHETARVRRATLVACNRILVPAFFSAGA